MTQMRQLGEFISTKKGYAFKSAWFSNHGVPVVKATNFTKDSIDVTSLQLIEGNIAEQYNEWKLTTDDVVVQTVGSWPSSPASAVGKCIRVPEDANGALLNQNTVILKCNERLDPDFLYYSLRDKRFRKFIENRARGSASQASITLTDIKEFQIFQYKLEQQREIGKVLRCYDNLIENNKRRIALLEESARQLYKEWFVRFRFPGHEHVKILNGAPDGWGIAPLSEVVEIIKMTVDPKDVPENTAYIGLEHIPRRSFTLGDWETSTKVTSKKYLYKKGDIIFGKIRPYFHKVGFALTDGITSSDAIVIRPKSEAMYSQILCELTSDHFIALASKTVREGSKMPRADWKVLGSKEIAIPPKQMSEVFEGNVRAIIDQCAKLSLQNHQLIKARDLLLPKLMTGELAV